MPQKRTLKLNSRTVILVLGRAYNNSYENNRIETCYRNVQLSHHTYPWVSHTGVTTPDVEPHRFVSFHTGATLVPTNSSPTHRNVSLKSRLAGSGQESQPNSADREPNNSCKNLTCRVWRKQLSPAVCPYLFATTGLLPLNLKIPFSLHFLHAVCSSLDFSCPL